MKVTVIPIVSNAVWKKGEYVLHLNYKLPEKVL